MAQLLISDIDDDVVERLRARAVAEKKSLEQKLRDVMTEAAKPSRSERIDRLRRIQGLTAPGPHPLAEDLIRQCRVSR